MAPQEAIFLTEFSATGAKPGTVRGHRSKGCITCRRRKVKCDERRPTCLRCEKGFHKCQGYDKPLVFVAQEFSTSSTSPPSVPRANKRQTTPSSQSSKSSPETALSDEDWAIMLPIKKKMSPARRVCQTVPLNAFKDEIVICHLLEKFSIGLGPSMAGVTDAPTMASVLTSHNANSNAYLSGLGLAEAFFGRVQKVDGMTEHASELYGQSLRNLRDDLQLTDQKVARSRAYMNLWSCVFLGLYEIVAASGQSSWMQHSKGMGILTELLGPTNFQSPIANTILDMNRSFIVTSYIVERKRCFLGRPEWQTVPWEHWTRPRTIISRTTDILCDVPGLMEDADAIIQAEEQGLDTEAEKLLLQDNLLQRIQRLADLVWQWDLLNPLACWEAPPDPTLSFSFDESGQPLFDTVYHFDDVERAIDVLNLNLVRLLLYGPCDKADLLDSYVSTIVGSQYDGPHANPLLLPGQGDRISHSLEICRCVDFLLSSRRQSRGALVLLFPLRVAWAYLGPLPAVSRWVGKVLKQLSTSQGLRIGEHVLEIDSR